MSMNELIRQGIIDVEQAIEKLRKDPPRTLRALTNTLHSLFCTMPHATSHTPPTGGMSVSHGGFT